MTTERFTGTGRLYQRPTLDVVVLILTAIVAVGIGASIVVVGVIEIRDPTADTSSLSTIIDDQVGVILGALLGLLAGQAHGAREARISGGAFP